MSVTLLTYCGRLLAVAGVGLVLSTAVLAQSGVWRCGNEYTNQPGPNPETRGCRQVEGGNLSIVEDTRPRAATGGATGATPPAAAASTPATPQTSRPPASGARSPAERVDRSEQQARDRDARLILDTELKRAQERVQELAAEYNGGQPTRLASERDNDARYRERTEELKRRLERAQSDVAAIEREIARMPATR